MKKLANHIPVNPWNSCKNIFAFTTRQLRIAF